MIAAIFRPVARDRHGDPVEDGQPASVALVGTATDVIIGGQHWQSVKTRGEVASTDGYIGFPRNGLMPTQGDRLLIQGVRYQVVGKPEWDHEHPLTGSDLGYAWVRVEGR